MPQKRTPSDKEISNKISYALAAIGGNSIQIIDDRHNDEALQLCDTDDMETVFKYIYGFLQEIQKIGAVQCFHKTGKTVEKSYHKGFKNIELFSYSWHSPLFKETLYLKFGTQNPTKSRKEETLIYFHLDLHYDRP